ncbi:alpha/beta hydrolase fold [Thermosinus carboxydivorans Nor1]|uniref:Alpha/beta hydrolase fold n=1 Tax=Thermosinus carboxydivorans Nor1 TaxID=401526 RepID=A1HM47_9FIRM|nr:alpha/beta hydrolase [Thermosinus carboxydivorans]EAX48897.1 alpha/beta hydrolase fold [Thermosinus carboxydivorans Nor1]
MFAKVNGINLYYEDQGQGPALVFIHGLGENASSWKRQIEFFSKSFRTIVVDLRGHGRSDDGAEFITMDILAKDVLALLDQLGIEKAHFVGHSMGGLINQEIAAHNLHRMLTMTLSDAAGYYPPPLGTTGLEERLKRIDTLSMEEVAEAITNSACRPEAPEWLKVEVRQMFAANRKQPYRQATISTLKADYRQYHARMKVPTLLLVGQFDKTTPLSYAQFLNEAIIGSKLQIIPDAAHMTKVENPAVYNRALAEFLAPYEPNAALPLLR